MPFALGNPLLHKGSVGERRWRRLTLVTLAVAVETGCGDVRPTVAATFAAGRKVLSRQLKAASVS